jgi:hypothetical protein
MYTAPSLRSVVVLPTTTTNHNNKQQQQITTTNNNKQQQTNKQVTHAIRAAKTGIQQERVALTELEERSLMLMQLNNGGGGGGGGVWTNGRKEEVRQQMLTWEQPSEVETRVFGQYMHNKTDNISDGGGAVVLMLEISPCLVREICVDATCICSYVTRGVTSCPDPTMKKCGIRSNPRTSLLMLVFCLNAMWPNDQYLEYDQNECPIV